MATATFLFFKIFSRRLNCAWTPAGEGTASNVTSPTTRGSSTYSVLEIGHSWIKHIVSRTACARQIAPIDWTSNWQRRSNDAIWYQFTECCEAPACAPIRASGRSPTAHHQIACRRFCNGTFAGQPPIYFCMDSYMALLFWALGLINPETMAV